MRRNRRTLEKPRVNMTPMIDMVFLLLTFFVMTFKIIVPEGDFNVKMAPAGQAQPAEVADEPVRIVLTADENGLLTAIQLNGENIANFAALRQRVLAISQKNPDLEIELFPDEHLRYEYVIGAVTAVNGELRNGQIYKICGKIKFAGHKKQE